MSSTLASAARDDRCLASLAVLSFAIANTVSIRDARSADSASSFSVNSSADMLARASTAAMLRLRVACNSADSCVTVAVSVATSCCCALTVLSNGPIAESRAPTCSAKRFSNRLFNLPIVACSSVSSCNEDECNDATSASSRCFTASTRCCSTCCKPALSCAVDSATLCTCDCSCSTIACNS